jgi:hypothetical protein
MVAKLLGSTGTVKRRSKNEIYDNHIQNGAPSSSWDTKTIFRTGPTIVIGSAKAGVFRDPLREG